MSERGQSSRHALNEEQVRRLLRGCRTLEERFVVNLALFETMRAGEISHINARWLRADIIRIPPSMPHTCNDCMTHRVHPGAWKPKSKAGARDIPIVNRARADIEEFLRVKPEGIGRTRHACWKIVKRVAKRAQIEDLVYTHSLRATCATFLATRMNAAQLAYVMGWSSISQADPYIRIAQAKEAAAGVMRDVFE